VSALLRRVRSTRVRRGVSACSVAAGGLHTPLPGGAGVVCCRPVEVCGVAVVGSSPVSLPATVSRRLCCPEAAGDVVLSSIPFQTPRSLSPDADTPEVEPFGPVASRFVTVCAPSGATGCCARDSAYVSRTCGHEESYAL